MIVRIDNPIVILQKTTSAQDLHTMHAPQVLFAVETGTANLRARSNLLFPAQTATDSQREKKRGFLASSGWRVRKTSGQTGKNKY